MQHETTACSRAVAADGGNHLPAAPRVILVLGGGDAGKSPYCRFLIAQLLGAGERPAVVDAHVGQKIMGPPATVTLGYAEGTAEQWTATAEAFHFVGSTVPVGLRPESP